MQIIDWIQARWGRRNDRNVTSKENKRSLCPGPFIYGRPSVSTLCIGQIEASTCPPRANPRAFDFFENFCSNSPLPGPKCRSNAPHWGPFRWSNAPTPGTFHRHKNDRRTEETPSIVEQNLYKYNKKWATLLVYLLRTNVSSKAEEIAATRSLNAQLSSSCNIQSVL